MRASPLSIMIPPDLRRRLEEQAERRSLKLSSVMKALVEERLAQIEDEAQLTRAEEWQRAQAWASWEAAKAGDNPEVSWREIDRLFEAGKSRPSARAGASSRTSKRRSRG